jgi:hypothetical protein
LAVAGDAPLVPMKRSSSRFSVSGSVAQPLFCVAAFDTHMPVSATRASAIQNVGAVPARSGHEPAQLIVQNPAG